MSPVDQPDPQDNTPVLQHMTGHVFWAALGVGLALTALGIAMQWLSVLGITQSALILCSGLGIIFGAFGSMATIRYKGVVIAGVAAIAIVLLVVVHHYIREDVVIVQIDGDVKDAKIALIGERHYWGAELGGTYEILILADGGEIRQDRMHLIIEVPEGTNGHYREIPFDCVPTDAIAPYLGSGRKLQWRFNKAAEQITDSRGRTIDQGPCKGRVDAAPEAAWGVPFGLVGSAHAQGDAIGAALVALESDSSIVRREARSKLADQGLDAIRPMLDFLVLDPRSYRKTLGVSVALTEMLRERKDQRQEFIEVISEPDLRELAKAAGDPDRTIRIYASEFLFDLGDPRVVPIALEIFPNASADGKYNLLIVVQGAVPYLTEGGQKELRAALHEIRPSVGTNTNTLIDRILTTL